MFKYPTLTVFIILMLAFMAYAVATMIVHPG